MNTKFIALLAGLLGATSSAFGQNYLAIPDGAGTPRASIYAFEDEIDVIGIRLGDTLGDVDRITIELQKEHGANISGLPNEQYTSATSRNGRIVGRYSYFEGATIKISQPGITEGLEIGLGTPASGSLVDFINRYITYGADKTPSEPSTMEAVRQKYGEPSYLTLAGGTSMSNSLFYIWFDGELLAPMTKDEFYGAPYKCLQYGGGPYRYEHGIDLPEGCTAILSILVTLDKDGRVSRFSQMLFSGSRHHEDRLRTDEAITADINRTVTGGDLPRL